MLHKIETIGKYQAPYEALEMAAGALKNTKLKYKELNAQNFASNKGDAFQFSRADRLSRVGNSRVSRAQADYDAKHSKSIYSRITH